MVKYISSTSECRPLRPLISFTSPIDWMVGDFFILITSEPPSWPLLYRWLFFSHDVVLPGGWIVTSSNLDCDHYLTLLYNNSFSLAPSLSRSPNDAFFLHSFLFYHLFLTLRHFIIAQDTTKWIITFELSSDSHFPRRFYVYFISAKCVSYNVWIQLLTNKYIRFDKRTKMLNRYEDNSILLTYYNLSLP
jgi:hypothetical protein